LLHSAMALALRRDRRICKVDVPPLQQIDKATLQDIAREKEGSPWADVLFLTGDLLISLNREHDGPLRGLGLAICAPP
jgi:hypothetical protein